MVGSALVRKAASPGLHQVITRSRQELDLLNQQAVHDFMHAERPDYLFIAAAKVGGTRPTTSSGPTSSTKTSSSRPTSFTRPTPPACNASCFWAPAASIPSWPPATEGRRPAHRPARTHHEAYAIAKIAGIKLCEAYNDSTAASTSVSCPPTCTGPTTTTTSNNSHVLPALIRKAHEAKQGQASLTVWGSGTPCASFFTQTTWPTPAYTSWKLTTAALGQHWHRARHHHSPIGRNHR